MTAKVFRTTFRQIFRKLWIICCLTILMSICAWGLSCLNGPITFILPVLQLMNLLLCIASVFLSLLLCWQFFRNSFYEDQAFLYQTLPVTRPQLFIGEILAFILCQIVVYLVLIFGLWFGMFNDAIREQIWLVLTELFPALLGKYNTVWLVVLFLIGCFEQLISELLAGVFGLVLGYRCLKNKLGKSILIGICSYYLLVGLMILILMAVAWFTPAMWKIIADSVLNEQAVSLMAWLDVLYVLVIGFQYGICFRSLKKGIDID